MVFYSLKSKTTERVFTVFGVQFKRRVRLSVKFNEKWPTAYLKNVSFPPFWIKNWVFKTFGTWFNNW